MLLLTCYTYLPSSRYSFATPFELLLNALGILCAIGAGAAQPLMSLIFGNLTNTFIKFGTTASEAASDPTPANIQALQGAADNFKSVASHDALLLVAIGRPFFSIRASLCS